MPKAQIPPALDLSGSKSPNNDLQPLSPSTLSTRSPRSPSTKSTPGSPFLQASHPQPNLNKVAHHNGAITVNRNPQENGAASITVVPETQQSELQTSPSPKHGRDPSKSFFSNLMASKSSHKLHSLDANAKDFERLTVKSRGSSKDRSLYSLKGGGSTPHLPRVPVTDRQHEAMPGHIPTNSAPDIPLESVGQNGFSGTKQKSKSRLGGILHRTKSNKIEDGTNLRVRNRRPSHLNLDAVAAQQAGGDAKYVEPPVKTAPLRSEHREKAFTGTGETGSVNRNRSADTRPPTQDSSRRDKNTAPMPSSHSFRDGSTLQMLSQTGKGVGDRLGKVGKGFFGKITRSESSNQRELVPDEAYTCAVINLPLVKQTRTTRIARRLELSKDKTEFWMPALPWRCIDYLNMNGCEEEGLYRIPGSGREVKHWQRRFDTEYDINLFDELELYDINIIGSMFKSWLRELPDEIFPRKTQIMISEKCVGATRTPQLLKDELSKLPPFNYYLLFAITCHLSLLHGFADKNKMDYRNLCICFQPCLKIDGFCFQFLVQDWKSCWQGCWTEKEYLEEEYRYEREGSVAASDEHSPDEHAVSSSGSSMHVRRRSATRSMHRTTSSNGTLNHAKKASSIKGNERDNAIPPMPPMNGLHAFPQIPPERKFDEPQEKRVEKTPETRVGTPPVKQIETPSEKRLEEPPVQLPEVKGTSPINISQLENANTSTT